VGWRRTGFSLFAATSPAMSMLAFFAIAFGFMFAIQRTKDSASASSCCSASRSSWA
jgi:hypothetical protein